MAHDHVLREADRQFGALADKGDVDAMYKLGSVYLYHHKFEINPRIKEWLRVNGESLLKVAADAGHTDAKFEYGVYLIESDRHDTLIGLRYLSHAGHLGHSQAKFKCFLAYALLAKDHPLIYSRLKQMWLTNTLTNAGPETFYQLAEAFERIGDKTSEFYCLAKSANGGNQFAQQQLQVYLVDGNLYDFFTNPFVERRNPLWNTREIKLLKTLATFPTWEVVKMALESFIDNYKTLRPGRNYLTGYFVRELEAKLNMVDSATAYPKQKNESLEREVIEMLRRLQGITKWDARSSKVASSVAEYTVALKQLYARIYKEVDIKNHEPEMIGPLSYLETLFVKIAAADGRNDGVVVSCQRALIR